VKAVGVTITHVAERDAVEGDAELVLVEAAQRNPGRPFVDAERIGRLEVDVRQLFDRLERTASRSQLGDVGGPDLGDLARAVQFS
jgi:hypothetical protein